MSGTFPGDDGTALTSAPPGGAVGADDGIPAIAENENSSFPGGSVGAMARGEVFPCRRKSGGEPATGGVGAVPGVPGTSAMAPASDAAIARKSDSVNGPGCVDGGEAGMLGADSTTDVS